MVSYEVGVQLNNEAEEEAEITFDIISKLKALLIEFKHRAGVVLYFKDIQLLEDQPIDIVRLKYNLLNGVELYNIRFGTLHEREQFLETAFRDRLQDSGHSSVDDSTSNTSTPLPPQNV
ncbi:hypothetical protein QE152_g14113 [Popillia japonica]|uniref:Uncharacterized protein n=1 Tax=Popillia japonica TaxID=7064 RepID=A0AAW1LAI1_POPJA